MDPKAADYPHSIAPKRKPGRPRKTDAPEEPRRMDRNKRIPLGQDRLKLDAPQRLGYRRYWFNDTPGRLEQAEAAGYAFVENDQGEATRRLVGTTDNGQPLYAYLMEMPEAWHEEDKAKRDEPAKQFDQSITRGIINGQGPREDQDGFYVPGEGIQMSTDVRKGSKPVFRP